MEKLRTGLVIAGDVELRSTFGFDAEVVMQSLFPDDTQIARIESLARTRMDSRLFAFSTGILVLTLMHLMFMTDIPTPAKIRLCGLVYCSAIFDEAGGWPAWSIRSYFKIGAFLILKLSLGLLIVIISHSLIKTGILIFLQGP